MFELSQWLMFVAASLALVAVPGPAVMFIVARTLDSGRRTGLITAAGIGLGNLLHALAAAVGVSALVAASSGTLDAVRYAGAAYLVYLGVRGLWGNARKGQSKRAAASLRSHSSDFVKGIFVALLNPKVILFLLAFLPQFVDPDRGSVKMQLLVLGVSFVVIGWFGDSAWALVSGSLARRLKKGATAPWTRVLSSLVYIVLGVVTAVWR